MVHLVPVQRRGSDAAVAHRRVHSIELEKDEVDDFYSSVYGSRYAAQPLPQEVMPEREMPREVAYRMIKDDLSLDGNPMLKFAYSLPLFCYWHRKVIWIMTLC